MYKHTNETECPEVGTIAQGNELHDKGGILNQQEKANLLISVVTVMG